MQENNLNQINQEKQLITSDIQTLYQNIFESSSEGILVADAETQQLVYANPTICNMLGYSKKELLSLSVRDLHPKSYESMLKDKFIKHSKGLREISKDTEFIRKDNTRFFADIAGSNVNFKDRFCNVAFIKDTTERKKAVDDLIVSEKQFRSFFENSPDYCYMVSPKGEILNINQTALITLGLSKHEVLGKQIISVVYAPSDYDRAKELVKKWIQHGKLFNEEIKIKTKKGERTVLLSVDDVHDDEGSLLFSILMQKDIQNLIETQRQLQEINKKLDQKVSDRTQEVNQLLDQKDEFINMLSHDLKNPLVTPICILPVIKKKISDNELLEMVESVEKSIKKIKSLIDDTLALARLDKLDKIVVKEKVRIFDVVDKAIEDSRKILERYQFTIDNNVSEDVEIELDKFLIGEVLQNLISNAVKYSAEDSMQHAEISSTIVDDELHISVKDYGIGVDQAYLDSIFEKFSKNEKPRNGFDSTGLGLSIVKGIVNRHGGRIWAESEGIGKGSTFFFTLPLRNKGQK